MENIAISGLAVFLMRKKNIYIILAWYSAKKNRKISRFRKKTVRAKCEMIYFVRTWTPFGKRRVCFESLLPTRDTVYCLYASLQLTYPGHVVRLEVLGAALLRDVVVQVAAVRVHRAHVQVNVLVS